MKTRLLIILIFIGLIIPISNTFATEPRIIPIFQPDVELIPGEKIIYGESFTIHAWLESYDDRPDDLGFHVDVLDPFHNQVDSTLWFAKQDFVYEFDTTHPAYNITKSGTYQIKIEKADLMQRTGIILKTISFEILFPEPEQNESASENCGTGNVFEDGICVSKPDITGSYEIVDENGEKICLGGRGMILNDQCQRIGNYDLQTGIPIVNNKEECDKLDGTWHSDRKSCDSKYAPVEYRFQFGPEHDVYDDTEEMRMASEKVYFAEESMAGGSGTSFLNDSDFQLDVVIFAILIGFGSFLGLMIFWRKRK